MLAEAIVRQVGTEEKRPRPTPPPTEWGTVPELLAAVFDRLGEVIRAVQHGYTTETLPQVRPYPRPITEIDRAKRRADEAEDHALDDLITQAQQNYRQKHQ